MSNKHTIILYRFTGRQGLFTIPKKWCEECDLLLQLVNTIIKDNHLEKSVRVITRPWFLWFLLPLLRHGSVNAPQLVIDGALISAGIVPRREDVEAALGIPQTVKP